MGREFADSPRTRVHSLVESFKRLKTMVFYASLLNIQLYKIRIEGKWCYLRKRVAPLLHFGVGATEKGLQSANLLNLYIYIYIYIAEAKKRADIEV